MDMMPLAMLVGSRTARDQASSALPGAPVVVDVEPRPRGYRTRAVTARVLERMAQAVAPKSQTSCNPVC